MKPVYIEVQSVSGITALGSAGTRCLAFELDMTNRQIHKAIFELLGGMTDADALGLLQGEFPEWFK